jgi:hypothetical protein
MKTMQKRRDGKRYQYQAVRFGPLAYSISLSREFPRVVVVNVDVQPLLTRAVPF